MFRLLLKILSKVVVWPLSLIGFYFFFKLAFSFFTFHNWQNQPPVVADSKLLGVEISNHLTAMHTRLGWIGSVQMSVAGKLILNRSWSRHLPAHSQKHRRNINQDTPFLINSLSKQMTAALTLKLQHLGILSLKDKICVHNSYFCSKGFGSIDFSHVLSHTSGISDRFFWPMDILRTFTRIFLPANSEQISVHLLPKKLSHKPGVQFEYTNLGYIAASSAIEKAAGLPLAQLFSKHIFEPVKMQNTTLISAKNSPAFQPGYVTIPLLNENHLYIRSPFDFLPLQNTAGAGSIVSTTADLIRWGEALLGDFFTAKEESLLWSPVKENYALGWVVRKHQLTEESYLWHNGGSPGHYAEMFLFPKARTVLVILSNVDARNNDLETAYKELRKLMQGQSYRSPKARSFVPQLNP